jgi:hypothetical protein
MNTALKISLVALSLAATGMQASATGSAEVSYVQPEKFTDVGFGSIERERTLQSLTQHFETLGKRLPDGQTLRVEVLDVNLAGEVWPRGVHEVRVLRGRADWPQMTLRYTVLEGSRTLKAGEARLADMSYLFSQQRIHQYGDLPYEKRMLDNWFKEELAPATP